MTPLLTPDQRALWLQLTSAAQHIVITCHRGPDGDAIGSTTALASWLRRHTTATVQVISPNIFPDFLKWIPGASDILVYEKNEAQARAIVDAADLIILCDHAELKRMDTLGDVVAASSAPRIVIDHHLNPEEGIASLLISQPDLCSACEVLLRVLLQLEGDSPEVLTREEAESLYTGMMTDTGAFTFASNRPEVFELISILLRFGIDKDQIYRNIFYTYSPDRMRLMGYLLYVKLEILKKQHTSIMTFTNAERRRFHILNGDTEGFVNLPLQIQGMKLSIFLREDTERPVIRVSLRSIGDFPCNELAAEFFNGGGHKNASGGEFWGSMEDAVAQARKAIQKYTPLLKEG